MTTQSILMTARASLRPPVAIEAGLLDLFAPAVAHPLATGAMAGPEMTGADWATLWRSDAIHRARNMAQLSTSLANVAGHPTREWLPHCVTAQARGLSRVYEALAVDGDRSTPVPCAEILREVVTRLTLVFGRARRIVGIVSAEPVRLPPDKRRALVLMCSELVINALKYGFPDDRGGTIAVGLGATPDGIELIVEDDGIGMIEGYAPGYGGGLLDRFGALLGATVTRAASPGGHGFRISVLLPGLAGSGVSSARKSPPHP